MTDYILAGDQTGSAVMPCAIAVTASIGIASLAHVESYDELFHRADSGMYRAKQAGHNRVAAAE